MIVDRALVHPGLRHGFFTRHGGVSEGIYRSLNCGLGSSDDPVAVTENRRIAMAKLDLPLASLCTAYQVHSAEVAVVDQPWPPGMAPRVDGLVTDRVDIALGILAADCAPILLADPRARVVGAAHAGWKGALAGVAEATVAAMERAGARAADMVAVVGPCIGAALYEVGPELRDRYVAAAADHARWFGAGRGDRLQFDLPGFVGDRLSRLGIGRVELAGHDTYADADDFFSYRRATHCKEPDYGRNLSTIALVGVD
ncbi:MAG: peptidoglycan editing factor PgeF [Alphaproteobacteria bacterium]|nr:peptidoglycan editing factor PgeF [Alphaproteobacteria bacterium]